MLWGCRKVQMSKEFGIVLTSKNLFLPAVVICYAVQDKGRLLRGSSIVQVDEWLVIDLLMQDRKVCSNSSTQCLLRQFLHRLQEAARTSLTTLIRDRNLLSFKVSQTRFDLPCIACEVFAPKVACKDSSLAEQRAGVPHTDWTYSLSSKTSPYDVPCVSCLTSMACMRRGLTLIDRE